MLRTQAHAACWALLLALGIGTSTQLYGQNRTGSIREAALRFEPLDRRAGLSHNTVLSLVQDRQGFLWIGTSDGLNRYDGYEFVVYRHDRRDTTSLSDNTVRQVLEDRWGTLWIRTGIGLDRFDRQTHRFFHYRFQEEAPALDVGSFLTLLEDHRGQLWVGTGTRLYRYDRRADAFDPVHDIPDAAVQEAMQNRHLSTEPFWDLYEDRTGTLWLSTRQGRLYKLDPTSAQLASFQTPWKMLDVAYDDQDRLWIMHAEGLGTFDLTTSAFTPLSALPKGKNASGTPILRDRNGILWLGSDDGLYRYDAAMNERLHLLIDPSPGAYLQNSVSALYEDRAGTLWVGTLSGLYRFDPHTKPFTHLGHDPTAPNSLSSNTVMALWEDTDGFLWVGTLGGGLNRVDRKAGTVTRYRHRADRPGSLCSDLIWTLYEASTKPGILWIGTDEGLCSLDRRTGRFTVHELPLLSTATAQPPINALREDRRGRLWVASAIGLYRVNLTTGALKRYDQFTSDQPALPGYAQALHVDRAGFLWIGTFEGDLYRLTTETEVFTPYPIFEQAHVTTEEGIWFIHEDANGVLWLGSDRGLTRFDPQAGTVKHYTQQDGLSGSTVYSILKDDAQHLWASTNAGLARFKDRHPEDPTFRTYDAGDGLKNTEFNRRAAFKSQRGEFFFGGMAGLTSFYPAQIQDNPYVPPVVLTQIQTSNRDTTVVVDPFGLDRLRLSYREYTVAFEFAALSYTNPHQNRYAYQLEGFDEGWIGADTRRRVQYTNIPPGTYTFRVKAANNDGLWNEEGVALPLTITPPFWQTWWFRLLVLAMGVGLLTVAYRYRVARLLEMERMRMRIARDLHDDIGSGLSSIALASELVSQDPRLSEEKRHYLIQVTTKARRMANALTDIIWLVEPERDRLDDLVEHLEEVTRTMLAGIDYTFDRSSVPLLHRIDPEFRRQVYLIYKEILHNIVKHAHATKVTIAVGRAGGRFVLRVEDNGVGFEEDQVHRGRGLKNMQDRAAQIGGALEMTKRPGAGTTVRLVASVS